MRRKCDFAGNRRDRLSVQRMRWNDLVSDTVRCQDIVTRGTNTMNSPAAAQPGRWVADADGSVVFVAMLPAHRGDRETEVSDAMRQIDVQPRLDVVRRRRKHDLVE
jgi:hypothetical protein